MSLVHLWGCQGASVAEQRTRKQGHGSKGQRGYRAHGSGGHCESLGFYSEPDGRLWVVGWGGGGEALSRGGRCSDFCLGRIESLPGQFRIKEGAGQEQGDQRGVGGSSRMGAAADVERGGRILDSLLKRGWWGRAGGSEGGV